jgi:hypothetical protein
LSKQIYVSASQIDNFRTCNRRWFYKSIKKISEPQTQPQQFGDRFAKAVEAKLKLTQIPKFDEITDATIDKFLSAADNFFEVAENSRIYAEKQIKFQMPDQNAVMVGYIDVLDLSGPVAHIRDHKTRSDKKYAPTHDELLTDLQLNIYAYAIRREMPDACTDGMTVGHINYIKPPKAKATDLHYVKNEWTPEVFLRHVPIDRGQNDATMAAVEADVGKMSALSDSLMPIDDVPFDTTGRACFKYGQPCTYSSICPKLLPTRNIMPLQKPSASSLPPAPPKSFAPTAPPPKPAQSVAPPSPAAPPSPSMLPPPPPKTASPSMLPPPPPKTAAPSMLPPPPPKTAQSVTPPPPAAATNTAKEMHFVEFDDPEFVMYPTIPVNPPAAPTEFPPQQSEKSVMNNLEIDRIPNLSAKAKKKLSDIGFSLSGETAHITEKFLSSYKITPAISREILSCAETMRNLHGIDEPNPFEALAHIAAKKEQVDAEEKAEQHDIFAELPNIPDAPPLAEKPPMLTPKMSLIRDQSEAAEITEAPLPIQEPVKTQNSQKNNGNMAVFNVYLECYPIKGVKYTVLEDWLDPIFNAMEETAGVKNWRSILEYGRAAEMLHVAVRNAIEGNSEIKVPPHIVVLSSYSEYARVLMDMLVRYAQVVVKK